MNLKCKRVLVTALLSVASLGTANLQAQTHGDDELLRVRESVWRTWFAGDTKALEQLVPTGTIVISSGEQKWKDQADVLRTSAEFRADGGKLVRLEFPRTEIQHFGDVAIIWSRYLVETELKGTRATSSGRVTEIFVWQHGHWTNPGWHTDTEK